MTAIKRPFLGALLLGGVLMSCSSESEVVPSNTGKLKVSVEAPSGFATRSVSEDDYRVAANYTVEVKDNEGNVKETFKGNSNETLELPIGTYTVTASYGKEENASRNTFLCTGSTPVNIGSSTDESVTVVCSPTCGKAAVKFDAKMADYYNDYYVEYSTPALGSQKVTWAKTDSEPWYLKVGEQGDDVVATIHLTPKDEYLTDEQKTAGYSEGVVTQTYNLKRNKAWTMNIKPNYTTSVGELGISITIDDSTNDQEVPIIVPAEWIVK